MKAIFYLKLSLCILAFAIVPGLIYFGQQHYIARSICILLAMSIIVWLIDEIIRRSASKEK